MSSRSGPSSYISRTLPEASRGRSTVAVVVIAAA
jgi:hypothetical protein